MRKIWGGVITHHPHSHHPSSIIHHPSSMPASHPLLSYSDCSYDHHQSIMEDQLDAKTASIVTLSRGNVSVPPAPLTGPGVALTGQGDLAASPTLVTSLCLRLVWVCWVSVWLALICLIVVMDDGWWMMDDGWWMTDDGWWMMDDGWWLVIWYRWMSIVASTVWPNV